MSIGNLENNLQELYLAAISAGHAPPKLIANWEGTYIYAEGKSLYAKLWAIFYALIETFRLFFLPLSQSRERKIQVALRHTDTLFLFFKKKVELSQHTYLAAIQKMLAGEASPNLSQVRGKVIKWSQRFKPWLHFIKSETFYLKQYVNEKRLKLLFMSVQEAKPSLLIRKIVVLEGFLQSSLPWQIFFKLSCQQKLAKAEKKKVQKLCQEINDCPSLKMHFLDQMLGDIIKIFQKITPAILNPLGWPAPNLAVLKLSLIKEGCHLFSQIDLKFMRSLKPRWHQDSAEQRLKGGQKLVLGINRSSLEVERLIQQKYSWGLRAVPLEIKSGGLGSIPLTEKVEGIVWSSTDKLTEADRQKALPIAQLLSWFIKEEKSPLNLDCKNLIYDRTGRLYSLTAIFLEREFKFNKLTHFIRECSKGNRLIYLFLSHSLKPHPCAQFYQTIAQSLLEKQVPLIKKLAAVYGICDREVIQSGEKLAQQLQELVEECLIKIELRSSQALTCQEIKALKLSIVKYYQSNNYLEVIPENFLKDFLETYSK